MALNPMTNALYKRQRGDRDTEEKKPPEDGERACGHAPATGFPAGPVVKIPPHNAGDWGSVPGPGRSHLLQSS